jgi:hypothetical protein
MRVWQVRGGSVRNEPIRYAGRARQTKKEEIHARSRLLEKARIFGFQSQARDNHEFPAAAVPMIRKGLPLTSGSLAIYVKFRVAR